MAALDRIPAPDADRLWSEAEGRSYATEALSLDPAGRRRVPGLTVAVTLTATIGAILWLAQAFDRPEAKQPGASSSPPASTGPGESLAATFVPSTRSEDDRTIVPVTFPNGATVALSYSSTLRIADLGATSYGAIDLAGCCSRDLSILYRDKGQYADTEPFRTYPDGRGGEVELWRALPSDGVNFYLVWSFGPWTLRVWDGGDNGGATLSEAERALWATHLTGRVADDRYLVLQAESPLELRTMETSGGPQVIFGSTADETVKLASGSCSAPNGEDVQTIDGRVVEETALGQDPNRYFGQWCDEQHSILVQVYGGQQFVDQVLRDIVIR